LVAIPGFEPGFPSFRLPKDSDPREGFIDIETFEKLRAALPEHLRPAVTFLYYSGQRIGAAQKITWAMVSADNSEITLPGRIIKSRKPHDVPLVGPLGEIGESLAQMRKKFPHETDRVFDFRNFRNIWNETCGKLGLGEYNKTTRAYEGLIAHDFRRSAARNLSRAGVDEHTAMKITGHRTTHIFRRYAIQNTEEVKDTLIKVGQYKKPGSVAEITASR
jgi:integrase